MKNEIRFIDLFAGIGGIRLGLEQSLISHGFVPKCVFTSEIKPHAIKVLLQNNPTDVVSGDITQISTKEIPDFDFLCAGFPCQAFSAAGNRDGFADTRGTMFFEVERILKDKRPVGFILENVEGLVNHDNGNTLKVIINNLKHLNYLVSYRVLNAKEFGIAQDRKRIYIVGIQKKYSKSKDGICLTDFEKKNNTLSTVLEHDLPISNSQFVKKLLSKYSIEEIEGKAIKDKRGGEFNIHSWDLELKGKVSVEQKELLNCIMRERRKKKWAEIIGIEWMDGMPLTKEQIATFFDRPNLQKMLNDLVKKGYMRYEYPKQQIVEEKIAPNGKRVKTYRRIYDTTKPKGYNIVAGKLSFEVGKILSRSDVAPTLVATDLQHLYVVDGKGIRKLTLREGLRLFGYPEDFKFDVKESDGFDLLGNTVVVPVIKAVANRMLDVYNYKVD